MKFSGEHTADTFINVIPRAKTHVTLNGAGVDQARRAAVGLDCSGDRSGILDIGGASDRVDLKVDDAVDRAVVDDARVFGIAIHSVVSVYDAVVDKLGSHGGGDPVKRNGGEVCGIGNQAVPIRGDCATVIRRCDIHIVEPGPISLCTDSCPVGRDGPGVGKDRCFDQREYNDAAGVAAHLARIVDDNFTGSIAGFG